MYVYNKTPQDLCKCEWSQNDIAQIWWVSRPFVGCFYKSTFEYQIKQKKILSLKRSHRSKLSAMSLRNVEKVSPTQCIACNHCNKPFSIDNFRFDVMQILIKAIFNYL